ncbi:MAG: LysR family transcriptional regulator, partial [Rhodobacteraceae bacterium]|nr:LysR family transcriptional regulator [Paracoccaceae bacterium]
MQRDNWDDLRFVLAVAEEGSVSGAARRLGVNHATVLRRIAAFEEATGVEIFDKTARGYAV